jgi:hypothetical protein
MIMKFKVNYIIHQLKINKKLKITVFKVFFYLSFFDSILYFQLKFIPLKVKKNV